MTQILMEQGSRGVETGGLRTGQVTCVTGRQGQYTQRADLCYKGGGLCEGQTDTHPQVSPGW